MTTPEAVPTPPLDAIIVSGGGARRLGGYDKTSLVFEGLTLLEHAMAAVADARRVCIVGRTAGTPLTDRVIAVVEDPPRGGPGAAIVAGVTALAASGSALTVTIAADLPRAEDAVAALLGRAVPGNADGVVAVDGAGRRQHLLAVYRTDRLRAAVAAASAPDGIPLRALLDGLTLAEVPVDDALCADVDSPDDAARLGIVVPPAG